MAPQDRLTLDTLLSDPLTQLVMRSDGITSDDVARAFAMARPAMSDMPRPGRMSAYTTFERWVGRATSCWMA